MEKQNINSSIISSLLEVVCVHPLDVYKTKYQQNNSYKFKIFLKQSLNYKYRGLGSRLVGIVPMRMVFWISQDIAENRIKYNNLNLFSKGIYVGFYTSLVQTIIDSPIENIKISKINNTPINKNLFRGFYSNYLRNNIFASSLYICNKYGEEKNINKFLTGSVGGLIGSIISQPIDYIKTNIQSNKNLSYKQIIYNEKFVYNCMNGCIARSTISFFSMGIGSFAYNYFKKNL
jgi:hypothetical protein